MLQYLVYRLQGGLAVPERALLHGSSRPCEDDYSIPQYEPGQRSGPVWIEPLRAWLLSLLGATADLERRLRTGAAHTALKIMVSNKMWKICGKNAPEATRDRNEGSPVLAAAVLARHLIGQG